MKMFGPERRIPGATGTGRTRGADLGAALRAGVCCGVLALVLTGCGSTSQPEPAPSGQPVIDQFISDARAGDASEEQLGLLTSTKARGGSMTYDDVMTLLPSLTTCVEGLGYSLTVGEPVTSIPGFPVPNIRYGTLPGVDPADSIELIQPCEFKYFTFASSYYQNQPSYMSAYYASIEQQRPQIVACLAAQGVSVAPDATVSELLHGISDNTETNPGVASCYEGDIAVD